MEKEGFTQRRKVRKGRKEKKRPPPLRELLSMLQAFTGEGRKGRADVD